MSNTSPFTYRNQPDAGVPEVPAAAAIGVLLIGAALGLAAGLLMAPKSGRDLRTDILSKTGNWKDIADAIAHGRDKLIDAVENSRRPTV